MDATDSRAEVSPSPEQTSARVQKEMVIVAPGPNHRDRNFMLSKFPLGAPVLNDPATSWKLQQEKPADDKKRKPANTPATTWVMEGTAAGKQKQVVKGTPEGGFSGRQSASYFVLIKQGQSITAIPCSSWYNFKPVVNRFTPASLEAAEAEMRKHKEQNSDRFKPTSVMETEKMEKEALAEKEKERNDPMMGGKKKGRKSQSDLLYDEDALFGSDSDDASDDLGASKRKGRGGKKGKPLPEGIDEDEMPEDIYAGEADELRPERPEEAEDWECNDAGPDDDDLDMGGWDDVKDEDQKVPENANMAEEEDEEELDEETRKLKEVLEKEAKEEEDEGEEEEGGREGAIDDDDDLDLDEIAADLDAAVSTLEKQSTQPSKKQATPPPPSQPAPKRKPDTPPVVKDQSQPAKRPRAATPPLSTPPVSVKPEPVVKQEKPGATGVVTLTDDAVRKILEEAGGRMHISKLSTMLRDRYKGVEPAVIKKAILRCARLDKSTSEVLLKNPTAPPN